MSGRLFGVDVGGLTSIWSAVPGIPPLGCGFGLGSSAVGGNGDGPAPSGSTVGAKYA